jgi:hypothetical protein
MKGLKIRNKLFTAEYQWAFSISFHIALYKYLAVKVITLKVLCRIAWSLKLL